MKRSNFMVNILQSKYYLNVNRFNVKKMIDVIAFNESYKFACNYEGVLPLVRTGTVKTSSLKSFCNALLLSCSKKFILEEEADKMASIDKLETDFKIIYRDSEIFSDFYNALFDSMFSLLDDFYAFIDGLKQSQKEDTSELRDLISILFDDEDKNVNKNKLESFRFIRTIFSAHDLKKISKLRKISSFSSLGDMKTHLLNDVQNFLTFQDFFDESNVKSRYIKLNTQLLIDSVFDISSKTLEIPEFDLQIANEEFFKIATAHFQCNIFTIDSKTESDIQFYTEYNPKLKSIILISFENHKYFEVIGKLRQTNIINRQFLPYEDVVQSILYHKTNSI